MSAVVVNTKIVTGRRKLRFESYEEVLTDVEHLAAGEVRLLGNWSFGQILKHLALAVDSMIDGGPFNLPAPVKFLMNLHDEETNADSTSFAWVQASEIRAGACSGRDIR